MSGKRGPRRSSLGPTSGILSLQVDVVGEDDQRALLVFQIYAAGGVGEDHGADVHVAENTHGKSDCVSGVAFVEMDTSLHGGHGMPSTVPITICPAWPTAVERGKNGMLAKGTRVASAKFVGEAAETGAEHQSDLGAKRGLREQEFCGGFGVGEIVGFGHGRSFSRIVEVE